MNGEAIQEMKPERVFWPVLVADYQCTSKITGWSMHQYIDKSHSFNFILLEMDFVSFIGTETPKIPFKPENVFVCHINSMFLAV